MEYAISQEVEGMSTRELLGILDLAESAQRLFTGTPDPRWFSLLPGVPAPEFRRAAALLELLKRFHHIHQNGSLRTPAAVYERCREMAQWEREHLRALYLNTRNGVLADEIISIGTATANLCHPREVFRPAVRLNAVAVILVHNHPSGTPEASDTDLKVTKQLYEAGQILDIQLLDHVIIAAEGFVSLKERGQLG